ncbi:MAG: P27 family phage terminase small subunit [Sphaerochaeta sp.]|uniref:P27 family phage terminase small subunit n=1 Tax=Sphaerochaeta sp. TaxID=1972642 RepID=UPI003D129761
MAKDGTNRGGAQIGAGRKPKALAEKIANGNPGGRKLKMLDLGRDASDLEGSDMPPVKEFMKEAQRSGLDLCAEEVFNETYLWLKKLGCEELISTRMLDEYAMSVARWIQCEMAISQFGFLAKHPTTGAAIPSPYVAMAQSFMKQINQSWYHIYQIVKENCTRTIQSNDPRDDMMERLLTQKPWK